MTTRLVAQACLGLLCLAALIGTILQRREVVSLRAEHRALTEQQRAQPLSPKPALAPAVTLASTLTENEKLERLRLRAEVTQLRQRQQDLESLKKEHDQLLAQLKAVKRGGTNAAPQSPGDFLKRDELKWQGLQTPAAAFESFVWAFVRWDTNLMFQAVDPEVWAHVSGEQGRPEEADKIAGFRILAQTPKPSGRVELEVEIAPNGSTEKIAMEQVNGQWRMAK